MLSTKWPTSEKREDGCFMKLLDSSYLEICAPIEEGVRGRGERKG